MLDAVAFNLVLIVIAAADPRDDLPQSLTRAREARSPVSLRTARIEYSVEDRRAAGDKPNIRFYSWKCAEDRFLVVDKGDEHGVVFRAPDGAEAAVEFRGPIAALRTEDGIWSHVDESPLASVVSHERPDRSNLFDLRCLGINPASWFDDYEAASKALGLPPWTYTEDKDGACFVVTGRSGDSVFRWWIDPTRDWSVVRTQCERSGQVLGETRFKMTLMDGEWFPELIEVLSPGDSEPRMKLRVHYAEFNRPEHPFLLGPEHIGIETGTSIDSRVGSVATGTWDGSRVIPTDEFLDRVTSGELSYGPTLAATIARLQAREKHTPPQSTEPRDASSMPRKVPTTTRAVEETPWQTFTREFIGVYELIDEQAQKAWLICRNAEERAELVRLIHRDDLSQTTERHVPPEVLESRRKRIEERIEEIFQKQLRARLFKLATRKQLEAGGAKSEAVGNLVAPR
ncbi:MAG: hypothetical protein IT450_00635 [Phycisphaerales bacterium]|nr:hypothetical protein [Phycisphaerales bacterium]